MQTICWDLHTSKKTKITVCYSRAFQGRVTHLKRMWTFLPVFNLCLLSPWGSNSKKMTLKGYDFLLHTKLVILGLLFLFSPSYSVSPLPFPAQKRSYTLIRICLLGRFFFLLLTTFFSEGENVYFLFQYNCILLRVLWCSNNCHEVDVPLAVLWKRYLMWSTNHLVLWLFPSVMSFLFLVGGGLILDFYFEGNFTD